MVILSWSDKRDYHYPHEWSFCFIKKLIFNAKNHDNWYFKINHKCHCRAIQMSGINHLSYTYIQKSGCAVHFILKSNLFFVLCHICSFSIANSRYEFRWIITLNRLYKTESIVFRCMQESSISK